MWRKIIGILITTLMICSVFASAAIVKEAGKLEKTSKSNIEFISRPTSKLDENEIKCSKPVYNAEGNISGVNLKISDPIKIDDINENIQKIVDLGPVNLDNRSGKIIYREPLDETHDVGDIDNFSESQFSQNLNAPRDEFNYYPPWADHWHDTETSGFCYWPFCWQDATAQSNSYNGYAGVATSMGIVGVSECEAWFGFSDSWTAPYDYNEVDTYFYISYTGVATAANVPTGTAGGGALLMYTYVICQIYEHSTGEYLFFKLYNWPVEYWSYSGDRVLHIHWDPPGAGTYSFAVQFGAYVFAESLLFNVVGGGIDIDASLDRVEIITEEPLKPDLLMTFAIDDTVCVGIDPWPFSPGDYVDIWALVFNIGDVTTGWFRTELWFDGVLVGYADVYDLPPMYYTSFVAEDFQWPNDLDWHLICWYTDTLDEVDEYNEDNNDICFWARAVGPPDFEIIDMTLTQCDPWPPTWLDWQNADEFEEGDRVTIWGNISNVGDGPGDFDLSLYMDGQLFAGPQTFSMGGSSYGWYYVLSDGQPGFYWPDSECHKFKWVVDAPGDYEEYCPGDNYPPDVEITRPTGGIYIADIKFMDLAFLTIIIGKITIEVSASDSGSGMDYVEFYIDDELKHTDHDPPWEWTWQEYYVFQRFKIMTKAYDNAGNSAKDEKFVWKFL